MRRRLILPLALAAATLLTPSAQAAWAPPTSLSAASSSAIDAVDVAAAADTSALVTALRNGEVLTSLKSPGEPFPALQSIGPGRSFDVSMTTTGRAVLAWRTTAGIRFATREPGGPLVVGSQTIATGAGEALDTAITASGRRFVAVAAASGTRLYTAPPGSTTFVAAFNWVSNVPSSVVVATKAGSEDAWVVASTQPSTSTSQVNLRTWLAASGAAGPVTPLDSGTNSSDGGYIPTTTNHYLYAPASAGGNHPSFFWVHGISRFSLTPLGSSSSLSSFTEAVGGGPQHDYVENDALGDDPYLSGPDIALDANGAATAAWATGHSTFVTGPVVGASKIKIARRAPGGGFGAGVALPQLTAPVSGAALAVAIAPTTAAATRLSYSATTDGGQTQIFSVALNAAGVPTAGGPTLLSTQSTSAVGAAGTGTGDTATAWVTTNDAGEQSATVQLDDVTQPELSVGGAAPGGPLTVNFEASASDAWSGVDSISWDFGDGATATGERVSHTFAAGGTARVTVTARDRAGNTTSKTVDTAIPAGPASAAISAPATLSGLSLSKKSFQATKGKLVVGKGKKPSKGTTLKVTLSGASKLTLTVSRFTRGYESTSKKSGKTCKATKPKNTPKAKRCDLLKAAGTVSADGKAGANAIAFSGVVAGKKLKAGKYQLTITPAGGTASAPLRFTILKG